MAPPAGASIAGEGAGCGARALSLTRGIESDGRLCHDIVHDRLEHRFVGGGFLLGGVLAHVDAGLERVDQFAVIAVRLGAELLDLADDGFDAVDRRQDQRHLAFGGRGAIAQLPDQRLRRMPDALQPVQAEEAGGALDGMDQSENAGNQRGVARIALELHELRFDAFEMLGRFG